MQSKHEEDVEMQIQNNEIVLEEADLAQEARYSTKMPLNISTIKRWLYNQALICWKIVYSRTMWLACKETLAFLLCTLLVLIDPVHHALGDRVSLGAVAMLVGKVSGSVGLNFRITLIMSLGTCLGLMAVAMTIEVSGSHPGASLTCLFLWLVLSFFAKSIKPTWAPGAIMAEVAIISLVVTIHDTPFEHVNPWPAVLSALFSILSALALCLCVNLIAVPVFATITFRQQMIKYLSCLSQMVAVSSSRFIALGIIPDSDIAVLKALTKDARKTVQKLKEIQEEAQWEFGGLIFWYFDEHTQLIQSLQHMARLASAMDDEEEYSARLSSSSNVPLTAAQQKIHLLQNKFKDYAVDLTRSVYESSNNQENKTQIEGLRSLLVEFDGHIKAMILPQDGQFELSAIHFKLVCFRELLMELLLLIEHIQAMHLKPKNLLNALVLLAVNTFQLGSLKTKHGHLDMPQDEDANTFRYKLWAMLDSFDSIQMKYAVKTALCITLLGVLSFADKTSDTFKYWRGQWALITISIVSLPTFGGSMSASAARVLGTFLAALFTLAVWALFAWDAVAISIAIVLYTIPLMYVRLNGLAPRFGVQALFGLTSMLHGFWAAGPIPIVYEDIYEMVYKRTIAIVVGVIMALVCGRIIWPYLARSEMRQAISKAINRLGLLYTLLQSYVDSDVTKINEDLAEIRTFEGTIQSFIIEAENHLAASRREPRLKGQLKFDVYERSILNCQRLLDHFSSLRVLLARGVSAELLQQQLLSVEDINQPSSQQPHVALVVAADRREQTADVLLFFYILSAAAIFKTPLPYYLPNIKRAVDKAFSKWRKLVAQQGVEGKNSFGVVLVHAYAANLRSVAGVLEELGQDFKTLFGVNKFLKYDANFRFRRLSTLN